MKKILFKTTSILVVFWSLFFMVSCRENGTRVNKPIKATPSDLLEICEFDYTNNPYAVLIRESDGDFYNYAQNKNLYFINDLIYDMRAETKYVYDMRDNTKDEYEGEAPSLYIQALIDSFKNQYQSFVVGLDAFSADKLTIIYQGKQTIVEDLNIYIYENKIVGMNFYANDYVEFSFDYERVNIQIPANPLEVIDLEVLGVDKYQFVIDKKEQNIKVIMNSTINYFRFNFLTNYASNYSLFLDEKLEEETYGSELTEGRYYIKFHNSWFYLISEETSVWSLDIEFVHNENEIYTYTKNNFLYSYGLNMEFHEFELVIEKNDTTTETIQVTSDLVRNFSTEKIGNHKMAVILEDRMIVLEYEVTNSQILNIPEYHLEINDTTFAMPIEIENYVGEKVEIAITDAYLQTPIEFDKVGTFREVFYYGGKPYEFIYHVDELVGVESIEIMNNISESVEEIPDLLKARIYYYDQTIEDIIIPKATCDLTNWGKYTYGISFEYNQCQYDDKYYIYNGEIVLSGIDYDSEDVFYLNEMSPALKLYVKDESDLTFAMDLHVEMPKIDTYSLGTREIKINILNQELVYNYEVVRLEEYLQREDVCFEASGALYLNSLQTNVLDEEYVLAHLKLKSNNCILDEAITKEIIALADYKSVTLINKQIKVVLHFSGSSKILYYDFLLKGDDERIKNIYFGGEYLSPNAIMIYKNPKDKNFLWNYKDYFSYIEVTFADGNVIKTSLRELQKLYEINLELMINRPNTYILTIVKDSKVVMEKTIILMEVSDNDRDSNYNENWNYKLADNILGFND